ncbi:UNVERIFIED_CONTAM: hypothetical protein Sangu_2668900, partial [Sesamum angustifolium]
YSCMTKALEVVRSNNEVAVHDGNIVRGESEMVELEMKEDGVENIDGALEFTLAGRMKREKLEASDRWTKRKLEKQMFKEILVPRHPITADNILQMGLLEGYSIFYNSAWLEGNGEQPQSALLITY